MFWRLLINTLLPFLKQCYVILLGSRCLLCHQLTHNTQQLCTSCHDILPTIKQNCLKCAQFLPYNSQLNPICGPCQASSPPFTRIYAAYSYAFPVVQLIKRLKFSQQRFIGQLFANCLAQKITSDWYLNKPQPDLIIPIPLHPLRYKVRGFNQAEVIARHLSRLLHIPVDSDTTDRVKQTLAQTKLNATARKENMKNAFRAKRSLHGLHIAVLDDVVTTTHTVRAFCQLLQEKGAKSIDVWCIARRG